MTKQELYQALHAAGVKLPEYRRITQVALEQLYAEHAAANPPAQDNPQPDPEPQPPPQPKPGRPGNPPALYFDHAGWCDALGRSYFMGYYWPQTWAEYDALRPFAKGGAQ